MRLVSTNQEIDNMNAANYSALLKGIMAQRISNSVPTSTTNGKCEAKTLLISEVFVKSAFGEDVQIGESADKMPSTFSYGNLVKELKGESQTDVVLHSEISTEKNEEVGAKPIDKDVHVKEAPTVCKLCASDSLAINGLSIHSSGHTEDEGCIFFRKSTMKKPNTVRRKLDNESFTTSTELKKHLMTRTPVHSEICTEIDEGDGVIWIDKDVNVKECKISIRCELCNESFTTSTELKKHQMTHTPVHSEICTEIDKGGGVIWIDKDVNVKGCKNSIQCKLCNESFATTTEVKKHLMAHRPVHSEICTEIDEGGGVIDKGAHVKGCKNTVQCELGNESFTTSTELEKHLMTHTPVHSEICTEIDEGGGAIRMDKNAHVKGFKNFIPCELCNVSFTTSTELEKHLMTHTPVHPEICTEIDEGGGVLQIDKDVHVKGFKNSIRCELCNESFTTSTEVEKHLMTHRSTFQSAEAGSQNTTFLQQKHDKLHTPVHSEICTEIDEGGGAIRMDKNVHVKGFKNSIPCELCNASFTTSTELEKHLMIHTPVHPEICTEIDEGYGVTQIDKDVHVNGAPTFCKSCGKDSLLMNGRSVYSSGHTLEEGCIFFRIIPKKIQTTVRCKLCNEIFATSTELKKHLMTHTYAQGEHHVCEICCEAYSAIEILTHMQSHACKSFACNICPKNFPQKYSLDSHLQTHSTERNYVCNICNKAFKQKSTLNGHRHTHTMDKQFSCHFCTKGFRDSTILKRHLMTHTGERPYTCEICGKGYTHGTELKVHLRSHTNERPYKCNICGKGFVRYGGLRNHHPIHSKVRKFACTLCEKSFKYSHSLTIHVRTHTKERPYVCKVCNKKCINGSNLKTHLRTHTHEKPYPCEVCGEAFTRRNYLTHHLLSH